MASAFYTEYKTNLLTGAAAIIDIDTDTIKAALVSTSDYTFSAAHTTMGDVTAYASTTDQTLSNITVAGANVDNTADLTWTSVAIDGAKDAEAVVLYKYVDGTATNNHLICYLELSAPITPNGSDIVLTPHTSGLYTL